MPEEDREDWRPLLWGVGLFFGMLVAAVLGATVLHPYVMRLL